MTGYYNRIFVLAGLMIAGSCVQCLMYAEQSQMCSVVSSEQRARLTKYIHAKYSLPPSVSVQIDKMDDVNPLCYKKVSVSAVGPLGKFGISLFLSPDNKYLMPDLYDLAVDPVEERKAQAARTLTATTKGSFGWKGYEKADVILTEFSDFECPFCKRTADIIKEVVESQQAIKVKVVFRNYPLQSHPWARGGAEAAACARFQNQTGFWRIHDFLFANQQDLTPTNLKSRVLTFVATVPGLNLEEFRSCLTEQMALGSVLNDIDLGRKLNVNATPTLFINGRQLAGINSAAELETIINDEEHL